MVNVKVPPVAHSMLRSMLAAQERDDLEDAELVYEQGAGWWLGLDRVSGSASQWLIRHVLISRDSEPSAALERWKLNEHGCEAARTGVVPRMVVDALAKAEARR